MAKKLEKKIKLQIPAGKANPAPPIGPALGAAGLNIMGFCKEFNAKLRIKLGIFFPLRFPFTRIKVLHLLLKSPPFQG